MAAHQFDPAAVADDVVQVGGADERLVLGHAQLDERAHVLGGLCQPGRGGFPPVAPQPAGIPGQCAPLQAQRTVTVAGVAQQFAGLTREGVGYQAGALDEPGVAEAGAVAGFLSVHQADPLALRLQQLMASVRGMGVALIISKCGSCPCSFCRSAKRL